ncbi:hypothetical protein [Streptomyces sp. NBC_00370]|uniref:hypothetical protein n=1 Tax=Streptomyces sp. NBC_00370 TaxID=2975728 RepID=UPI002E25D110
MRKALLAAALMSSTAVLLAGCGGGSSSDASGGSAKATAGPSRTPAAEAPATPSDSPAAGAADSPAGKGLDGTWRPINDDSPIATLTVTGTKVTTTGKLACPGTITGAGTKKPVLTLACQKPDPERTSGTLEQKPDGSAVVINWEGPAWGGMIDSLKRA